MPPPAFRLYTAQFLSYLKLAIFVIVVSGYNPFPLLNLPTPSIYTYAVENKVYFCLMTFFLFNAIEGQMYSTGAFEVMFNDMPVWSKLESGRVPSPHELIQIIDNQMHWSGGSATQRQ